MMVCVKCAVKMHCVKNGMKTWFDNRWVYQGDRWECPLCEQEVVHLAPEGYQALPTLQRDEYDIRVRE